MFNTSFRPVSKDIELNSPPPDSISKILFSPVADILAIGSWDNGVRLYDVNSQGQSQPKSMHNHEAPVLDLTWSKDGQRLISSGCDNAARMYDLATGQSQQVAAHDAPIKCLEWLDMNGGMLVTGGWDKKLKYWDLRSPNAVLQVDLMDKVFAMDFAANHLVIAMANRHIQVYNLSQPNAPFETLESPLKWQTRTVALAPTGDWYAVGSIEGRVGVQYVGDSKETVKSTRNYSFKCHRYDIPANTMPGTPSVTGSQNVFAVNTITFHKQHATFCTGGSDGSITFWDGLARTKVKPFSLKDLNNGDSDVRPPQWGTPIVSTAFNHNHEIFAYALSYDWSRGHSGCPPNSAANTTKVMLHPVKPDDVKKNGAVKR